MPTLVLTTRVTFAIEQALRTGAVVRLDGADTEV
jgi:hypothetical protein